MSNKIRKFARDQECTVRLPLHCNRNPQTTVAAHINGVRFGHGTGIKVNDLLSAHACSSCHDVVDGRVKSPLSDEEIRIAFLEGVMETQLRLLEAGLIKV
jgi:hypothetical protein